MFKEWIIFSCVLRLTISQNRMVTKKECAVANRTYCTIDDHPLDEFSWMAAFIASSAHSIIRLCDSYETVIYPKNVQSEIEIAPYFLSKNNQKRGIRVNMCSNAGGDCRSYVNVPKGYTTKCKQETNELQLVSSTSQGEISTERFEFPATCSCVIVKDEL